MVVVVVVGDIAIIVTSSRLQVTLIVETCVELELSLPESDLEPSLLIVPSTDKPIVQFLEHPESTKPGFDSKETASIG